jgi:hypothetical protein
MTGVIGKPVLSRSPLYRHDAVKAMKLVGVASGRDATRLDISGEAIMRRTAERQRLPGGIGDKAGALVTKPAQDMPYSLGRPLREWNTSAGDIGSGLVGGAALVLRLPRDVP